ncbi:hypothetical protein KIN20_015441 [Parelaphostrongylus tenuis]|uniref:Uncharacterized protein n=1 Tax=Parelaphostrongylus tenuis TaxID=148309 RepID=A0AAD5MEW8_PARTN|nr:hypothetical protein KIN20_015441 [Parelaphostrongylus tenuis]
MSILEEEILATHKADVDAFKTALTRAFDANTLETCASIVGNFRDFVDDVFSSCVLSKQAIQMPQQGLKFVSVQGCGITPEK